MPSPIFRAHLALLGTDREKVIAALNSTLATTLDLHSQVKKAHWNVKGTQFCMRHELFDRLSERLLAAADDLAERASTLGGYAIATLRETASATELDEYDFTATGGADHTRTLIDRYATFCERIRSRLLDAADANDAASEDLYINVLRNAELDMWLLENHLANDEPRSNVVSLRKNETH